MPLTIEIVTPERIVFQEEGIDSVTLPGIEGELTVLPRHAALMTALQAGALRFRSRNRSLQSGNPTKRSSRRCTQCSPPTQ